MSLVFIYGTLKRGHGNHRLIEQMGGFFVDTAKAGNYGLVNIFDVCPGMVRCRDTFVTGELWSIRAGDLWHLDAFETDAYERKQVQVVKDSDGRKVWADTYLFRGRVQQGTPVFSTWEGR